LGALKQYAANKLPANVNADFLGAVPNTEVYSIYRECPFHVYINVSEVEGVPVSIMEAMSFDIPVIATAVGGTPELVDDGENGFLLPADFTDDQLAALIRRMMDMPEPEYQLFRENARKKFEQDYNAIPNYRKFIKHLADMSKEL
ncbi:MAG: glycosyltransferase, partial [Eubacteriales bacterium]